ncbi:hypothetical protein [Bacillus massiliigorillae]|uniref:hypothetical protein n=1 Tax=Bacillus massiliigorillae TaxID=1243664 RepID=UPI0005A8CC78|nr:hypothetical protein [Bacillus massiliigorillae]
MKHTGVNKISSLPRALNYQEQWMYEAARTNNQKDVDFQENLLQTLNRIETKLDILLMQKQK